MKRDLTEIEQLAIRKAIMAKGLSSAEILLEVYDHYVSHLQECKAEDFDAELAALEEKFTYGYCHALQANLQKSLNTEITRKQWKIIKSYFCSSRLIYSLGLLSILVTVSLNFSTEDQFYMMVFITLALLIGFSILILFKWRKSLGMAKRVFPQQKSMIRSYASNAMAVRALVPAGILNAMVSVPRTFLATHDLSFAFLPQISLVLTMALLLYGISLFEVWKIKSKSLLA